MRIAKSPTERGFDRFDQGRLQRAIDKVNNKRTFVRLKALLLIVQGYSLSRTAAILGKSVQIIYSWIEAYLDNHDVEALFDAARSGRPRAAPQISDQRILRELQRNPLKLGYRSTVWTVQLLADHLSQRYGCQISSYTLYRRMIQLGLKCKRPRYVYSEKDPHRAQKKAQSSVN